MTRQEESTAFDQIVSLVAEQGTEAMAAAKHIGLFAKSSVTGDGLFMGGGTKLLFAQLKGIVAVGAFTFVGSLIIWYIVKAVMGLRELSRQPRSQRSGSQDRLAGRYLRHVSSDRTDGRASAVRAPDRRRQDVLHGLPQRARQCERRAPEVPNHERHLL